MRPPKRRRIEDQPVVLSNGPSRHGEIEAHQKQIVGNREDPARDNQVIVAGAEIIPDAAWAPAGIAILTRWLSHRPTHEYIAEGLHDIYLLAQAEDDIEVDFSELPGLLSYAEAVGRSTARALDRPDGLSSKGDEALEEVARELHIDHGESWARLLDELGERRAQ